MPVVSRFFGITIIMYWKDHNPPHFHAKYSECDPIIAINGELIDGNLPKRALSMINEWLILHRNELIESWQRAANGQEIKPIAPLE